MGPSVLHKDEQDQERGRKRSSPKQPRQENDNEAQHSIGLNFSKDNTKLIFATVKLLIVIAMSVFYLAFGKWTAKLIMGIGVAE